MKKYGYIGICFLIAWAFCACDDDDYSLGTPSDKTAALVGEWTMKSVHLTDEAGTKKEMDITSFFHFDSYKVTFKSDKSFTIEGSTSTPNFVGLYSGTWSYDDAEAPLLIQLTDGSTSSQFTLIAPPKEGTDLRMKFVRTSEDKAIVSYRYEMTKSGTID